MTDMARRILYFYSLAEKYGFKDPTSIGSMDARSV